MKVIEIKNSGAASQLIFAEREDLIPSTSEVLIRTKAFALNRADLLQREGKYPPPSGASDILGLEVSGEVVEVGTAVTCVEIGEHVCALLPGGGYAENVAVDQSLLWKFPSPWEWTIAAAFPEVFITSYQTLFAIAKLKAKENVLIHAGASGVGSAAIQLAKAKGCKVAVTCSGSKRTFCLELGADLAIDYQTEEFGSVVKNEMDGVDVILDCIGASYFARNLEVLRRDGRLVSIAFLGGAKLTNVSMLPILSKRLSIFGSTLRSRSIPYKAQLLRGLIKDFGEELSNGSIKPVIDRIYPWVEIADAHARMEQNLNLGKIVVTID